MSYALRKSKNILIILKGPTVFVNASRKLNEVLKSSKQVPFSQIHLVIFEIFMVSFEMITLIVLFDFSLQ